MPNRKRKSGLHLRYEVFAWRYKVEVCFDNIHFPEDRDFVQDVLYAVLEFLRKKANQRFASVDAHFRGGYFLKEANTENR